MYKECKKQGAYYIIIGEGVEYRVGLCMPKKCSVGVIAAVKPEIAHLISSALGTPVGEDKLLLIDTREFAETFSRIWPSTAAPPVVSAVLLATIAVVSVLDYRGAFPKEPAAVWTKALVCFSVQRNIGSLMNTENRVDGKLEVLNGIRVWSICWVVIGHVFEASGGICVGIGVDACTQAGVQEVFAEVCIELGLRDHVIMMMEGVMNLDDVIYDIDNSFFISHRDVCHRHNQGWRARRRRLLLPLRFSGRVGPVSKLEESSEQNREDDRVCVCPQIRVAPAGEGSCADITPLFMHLMATFLPVFL